MLFQPRDQLTLCQRFRRRFSRFVVQVTEAQACPSVVMSQSGSTSLIQRKFSIGFNRAGRLMDQLEKSGIVGPAQGAKPREVLIQDEVSLNNLLARMRGM